MSLVNITDFNEALVLLGLYEREVMKTGILDYPAQWPEPSTNLPLPKPDPESVGENTTKAISESSTVDSPEPVNSNSHPESNPPLPPGVAVDNVENLTVMINEVSNPAPDAVEAILAQPSLNPVPETICNAQREALFKEQEKERRLFYLFVEELERTGDLRKLPTVLHSPSRS